MTHPTLTRSLALLLLVQVGNAQSQLPDAEPRSRTHSQSSEGPGRGGPAERLPLVIEGRALLPGGAPAHGALVVSSAGGLAEVRDDGTFVLTLQVEPELRALQLSAVATGPHGSLSARRSLHGIVPGETSRPSPLYLTGGAGCTADWLPTFGGQPGVLGWVYALAVHDDGSGPALYAAGWFSIAGATSASNIAKWDGLSWSALGSGLNGQARALAVHDDGSGPALYVAGSFSLAGGVPANCIAKWNGLNWSGVGGGFDHNVFALEVHDDGTGSALYAGGMFTQAGGIPASRIAKWDGAAWSPVGFQHGGNVHALRVYDAGFGLGPALYAGGSFTSGIVRWDGSTWAHLPAGGVTHSTTGAAGVLALAVHDDGSGPALFVGGYFTHAAGNTLAAPNIARWKGTTWSALAGGTADAVYALASHDDGTGAALYAGGQFSHASFAAGTQRIAKWDGAVWSGLGNGISGVVYALASHDDGSGPALYPGGNIGSASGVEVIGIARWDASAWSSLGFNGTVSGRVFALAVYDDGTGPALYVGGEFSTAGGVQVNRIAKWDGALWSALGSGIDGSRVSALTVYDDGTGPALFAAGAFTSAGGVAAARIAKWDGAVWSPLGSGMDWYVAGLTVHDDGQGPALYATGPFTTAGGVPAPRIARWDGLAWSALGSGLSGGPGTIAGHPMAVFDDGSGSALYVGGTFENAGGTQAMNIAKWNGSTWSALGSGLQGGAVALEVHDDGSGPALYVGGAFTAAGGSSVDRVARWNGSSWSSVGSGVNNTVWSLAVYDDGTGPALYAGGDFTLADGSPANRVASWDGVAWTALGDGVSLFVRALGVHDAGSGPGLFVGGYFDVSPAGDSYVAQWKGCATPAASAFCFGDGSGAACPCANQGAADEGCANSSGSGARLENLGTLSIAAADLVLAGSQLPAGTVGLFFQGNNPVAGGAGVTFGDGLRCVAGGIVRLQVVASGGAGSMSTTANLALAGGVSAGETRHYQLWYRDALGSPCGHLFNLTHGLSLTWAP